MHPGRVLDRVVKQHQIHGRVALVILGQNLLQQGLGRLVVLQVLVDPRLAQLQRIPVVAIQNGVAEHVAARLSELRLLIDQPLHDIRHNHL